MFILQDKIKLATANLIFIPQNPEANSTERKRSIVLRVHKVILKKNSVPNANI